MPRLFSLSMGAALAAIAVIVSLAGLTAAQKADGEPGLSQELALYAGSESCIKCHKKFYQLWATSRHGLAMQPYTSEFVRAHLTPQQKDVIIGKYRYRADIAPKAGWVLEIDPTGKKKNTPSSMSWGARTSIISLLL